MKNIVITGAGPIGLYLAIRFKQIITDNKLDAKVTVIDPRVGEYGRPGVVANMALKLLSENIGRPISAVREGDDTGTSMFIQDLELALYKIAKELKVNFVRAGFDDFTKKSLSIKDAESRVSSIPCDIAIDCSGPKRALVKKFNEKNPEQPFEIKNVGNNPLKNHFIAYVNMDTENAERMHEKLKRDPLKRALAFERLRTEFGWAEFTEPEFSLRTYTMEGKSEGEKRVRFYFYFEVPPALMNSTQEKQRAWLEALISLKTERNDIQFEIESGKMKFIPFLVDPHKVVQPVLIEEKNGIIVIPGGDAQIEPDYRIGVGIWSGINRANALLGAVMVNRQRELMINIEQYESEVRVPIGKHESELEKDYRIKRSSLDTVLEQQKAIYTAALQETSIEVEQRIIQSGLDEINRRIAMNIFRQASVEYK